MIRTSKKIMPESETHPSWGLVSFSRTSGRTRVFGSDLVHHETIKLRISRAQRKRELSRDWLFGRDTIVEIELSPNQFAGLLTLMNQGDGVPCSIRFLEGVGEIPGLEEPPRVAQAEQDLQASAREVVAGLDSLEEAIVGVGLSKAKTNLLLGHLHKARQGVASSMPFILTQFQKAMGNVVQDAKASVDAFVTGVVTRTGLKALKAPELLTSGEVGLELRRCAYCYQVKRSDDAWASSDDGVGEAYYCHGCGWPVDVPANVKADEYLEMLRKAVPAVTDVDRNVFVFPDEGESVKQMMARVKLVEEEATRVGLE